MPQKTVIFMFTAALRALRTRPGLAVSGAVLSATAASLSSAQCNAQPAKVTVLRDTPLTRSLQTIMRDQNTTRERFVLASNRLTHLLIEEALSLLPSMPITVQTPCGPYEGTLLPAESSVCGVSILRAADCMLGELRSMMPSVVVGKILIQRCETTCMPKHFYSKLPPDISKRPVLLLDPMLATGGSAVKAIDCLVEVGVRPENIVFVNIVCVREGINAVHAAYPQVHIVTAAIDPVLNDKKYIVPGLGDFGDRYFGTDGRD